MAKNHLAFFNADILNADLDTKTGRGASVYDSNGEFIGFGDNHHSWVDVTWSALFEGAVIRHRINDRAALIIELTELTHGRATYAIEVDIPDSGIPGEFYLCPVCGSSGPHLVLPDLTHHLASDGTVSLVPGAKAVVRRDSRTVCQECDYSGEKGDFRVKSWKDVSHLVQPDSPQTQDG